MVSDLYMSNYFIDLYEKPVFLYGSGHYGRIALKILKGFGIIPEGFCDTNSALRGNKVNGISVRSLDELLGIASSKEIIVIITTASCHYREIVAILEKNQIRCRQIYTLTGLIYAAYFNLDTYGKDNKLVILKKIWLHNQRLDRNMKQASVALGRLLVECEEKPPIIVYHPGKVGSSTLAYSLGACGEAYIYQMGITYASKLSGMPDMKRSLLDCIDSIPKLKMITLVREPISKDLGHFFQKIDWELNDAGWFLKGIVEQDFQRSFLNYLSVVTPFDFTENNRKKEFCERLICHIDAIGQMNRNGAFWGWYEEELKNNLGIDILSEKFNTEKGYSIIEHGNIELLVLKLEKLNSLEDVIGSFVGNSMFKIISTNQGESKSYMYAYRQFMEDVILPQEYIDFYYKDNPYTNHFYSESERNTFYEKWKKHVIR